MVPNRTIFVPSLVVGKLNRPVRAELLLKDINWLKVMTKESAKKAAVFLFAMSKCNSTFGLF